jgi:hypothetical protein
MTHAPRGSIVLIVAAVVAMTAMADVWTSPATQSDPTPAALGPIAIDTVAVPLNPQDPAQNSVGEFRYAGGIALSSRQTDSLHELSDIAMTGPDQFVAIGDEGILLEGRVVLDAGGRLIGITEAHLARLLGPNGRPLADPNADAEGIAVLANGDRLVSFETRSRIWRYPRNGGPPRAVPSPRIPLRTNEGMEALTADPDAGGDAYIVGAEDTGETWNCRVTTRCIKGLTVDKPMEFGLVAMNRLPADVSAYLLRAYDPVRRSRITLRIMRKAAVVAHMELAVPLTVDNFEGMTSVARTSGDRRFYLLSDDNNRTTQRTLLLAFDWQPR